MNWKAAIGASVWAIFAAAGMGAFIRYEHTEGRQGEAPKVFPAVKTHTPSSGQGKLLVFVHPQCPCSRATVAELGKLTEACGDRLSTEVVFVIPKGAESGFERGDLWDRVGAIKNVTRSVDRDEMRATEFGAETSGDTVLYDEAGHLVFKGGLTISRGHEGDNAGVDAVEAWALNKRTTFTVMRTPVFGCPLSDECRSK